MFYWLTSKILKLLILASWKRILNENILRCIINSQHMISISASLDFYPPWDRNNVDSHIYYIN